VIEALPGKDGPVNQGDSCVRGRFSVVEFIRSLGRLKSPLLSRKGELVEVPWEIALQAAAEGIRVAPPGKSALVYSGSCTNESIYFAHKFARDVLKTTNVDSTVRFSYGPLLDANGNGTAAARISDLTEAAAVLVVGADPDFSHPVLAQKLKQAVNAGHTSLVVIAPHATGLSSYASCEIRHKPGEEGQILDSLSERLHGGKYPSPRDDAERAAEILGKRKEEGLIIVVFGSGLMRRLEGTSNRERIGEVAKALSARVLPLLSSANDRGAVEIASFFACDGLTAPEIFRAARDGELDFLYLMGADIPPGNYDTTFVLVQDMFLASEAGKAANVVLPAASFTEVEGTYTNMEGRIQRVRAATRYAMGSMSDCDILSRLARKLEAPEFDQTRSSKIMAEIAATVPFYKGAAYKALERNGGVFGRTATVGMRQSPLATRTARVPRSEQPGGDYPFSLIAEWDEYVYKAAPLASQVRGLQRLEPAGKVMLSLSDAEAMGVESGMPVNIISRTGSVVARAAVSEGIQEGTARMVARGGDGSVAVLLHDLFNPASETPEEICAVQIERM
jgi:predicted molibdopterin-dependent oxidoreductase YjgC